KAGGAPHHHRPGGNRCHKARTRASGACPRCYRRRSDRRHRTATGRRTGENTVNLIFDGIRQRTVQTPRLAASVLERDGTADGIPVVFVHGNVSSSLFWQPTMLDLPAGARALAIDL